MRLPETDRLSKVRYMRERYRVIAVAVLLILAAAVPAIAGQPGRQFAKETARGEYAIANAAGNVNRPTAIYVRVVSRPRQKASGAWAVTCAKGFGAGSKNGRLRGKTPFVRRLRMPYARPSSCVASANAQLSNGGFVKVQLLARH